MFNLFVIDWVISILISLGLSYYTFESLKATICILPFIAIIFSFFREHEYKVRGRLEAIKRQEYLKRYRDYDSYIYVAKKEDNSPSSNFNQ